MGWTTPKTNWVDGEYFNVSPDYERIKGNIEYLIALSKTVYTDYTTPELQQANRDGYPRVSFFNNVVNATRAMLERCYTPPGAQSLRLYTANSPAWTASDLNALEMNHLLLYHAFTQQSLCVPRLQLVLGGNEFGC